ncbi:alpha-glucuronidase family glycosyl hydrolase [Sorangium sp. So ce1335]|uniref:alpha-glucuronidase family glycosyl hydrolase n=1 Tax=Sorangium sp. So ce1335 TaxID=3133335 RepID=UPI003F5E1E4A
MAGTSSSASGGSGGGASTGTGGGGGAGAGEGEGAGGSGGALGCDEEYPAPDSLPDETGADLWLRYPKVTIPGCVAEYQAALKRVVKPGSGATLDIAEAELVKGLSGLTGAAVDTGAAVEGPGAVVIGTATADIIKDLPLAARLGDLGPDGYLVEAADVGGQPVIAVAGNTEVGVLYGTFALLRHLQSHRTLAGLSLTGKPRIEHRILNHWDNLDRSVERGYAGRSIWDWSALPGTLSPRYKDYARANASLGINGTVLTNVNANAQILTPSYLTKVKALADVFRPYGIKVYLTARFSAPIEIGNLSTADPNNANVKQWWATKVDEIYRQIPDFGGFLVKANSEGQPGPQDYNRTHADGANMLADAVAPHGGIVMWRAFVYSDDNPPDRIKQAYEQFKPLDGKFKDNVLVQAKNGPLDFQPREPFHPLFGAMPETPLALELQITKEYLGEDTHLAYLGPLFEEVLDADTYADGEGSTVAKVIDGSLHGHALSAIAGVSNVGDDANWTGSHMNQANWYAFGRLAWNPDLSAEAIAEEWVRQTFSNDPAVVTPVVRMMMSSHQALVDYMTPLGLVHIMGTDHHYGPAPWVNNLSRAEWNPFYYHKADASGVGFNRTSSGSNAVAQYFAPVAQEFGGRETVPEDFLLFFHRVGWQDELSSGRTLWEELVHRYSRGVDEVGVMRDAWQSVEGRVDSKRFADVAEFLEIQHYEARWWRDACLAYFGQVARQQVPAGYAPLSNSLSFYQGLSCPSDVKKPRCSQVYTGEPSPAILP